MANSRESVVANQEAIARRAYELYLSRGGEDGHDLEDWFAAEKEIKGQDGAKTQPQSKTEPGPKASLKAKSAETEASGVWMPPTAASV